MKTSLLSAVVIIALLAVGGYALAQGCNMPGMNHGGAQAGGGMSCHATPAAGQSLPPAENLLQITGTVVSIQPNGAALVDTGEAKLLVTGSADAALPLKVGDRVQIAGVLMALTVQPAPAEGATTAAPAVKQARFQVGNILCGACSNSVKAALLALHGVQTANVGPDNVAEITYDPAEVNVQSLSKTIVGAKHPHQGMHFTATLLQ